MRLIGALDTIRKVKAPPGASRVQPNEASL
jgi:hypothetical protein